jgi:hypothetical protein
VRYPWNTFGKMNEWNEVFSQPTFRLSKRNYDEKTTDIHQVCLNRWCICIATERKKSYYSFDCAYFFQTCSR